MVSYPPRIIISPEFLRLEYQRVWRKVWQVACREEELPRVGDFVTYDIGDQSVIVVRVAPDELRAYHNVCLHRGRRLPQGCGKATKFHCNYHGWQWGLDGRNLRVIDKHDWGAATCVSDESLRLREVLVDTWGGFVFVNLDLQAQPLAAFRTTICPPQSSGIGRCISLSVRRCGLWGWMA